MHVYKSYPYLEYLYEIAENAPDNFGLSIEFNGLPETIGDQKFARCDEIFAATVVDLPAANPTGLFAAKEQNNNKEEAIMNDEEVKKLGETIVAGLKPVFENAFRAKPAAPTPEEKKAAGVADDDTEEVAAAKLTAFRAKADKPVSMKDLMSFFRFTGNVPAKTSAEPKGDEGDKGGAGFWSLVQASRGRDERRQGNRES